MLIMEVPMDPLTSLVTALAAGAAAALKSTVEQAVKDSYAALKKLIQRKYTQVQVNQLEINPSSRNRRGVIEEELKAVGADTDAEVLQLAQALLDAIRSSTLEATASTGVELKDIEGASLTIRRVIATGTGAKLEKSTFDGDITIEDIKGGSRGRARPNV
jgi:succinyl-CoA synthetase beta subunit